MAIDWQARQWLTDIFVHDVAEKAHALRATFAKGFGLNPQQYARPFPGSQTTVINAPQEGGPMGEVSMPGLKGFGLAAALGLSSLLGAGAGSVGTMLVGNLLKPAAAAVAHDATADVRVFWGDREITPDRPAEAVTQ